MDMRKIADLLKATIDPQQREAAEAQLKQVEKIIGVAPALLQIVMSQDVDMPVRQAGSIYLKNMITRSWEEAEEGEEPRFHIHEQDRAVIRDALVDAVVHAPKIIRDQLCVCIGTVCKRDFPGRWSSLVDKIVVYLQSPDAGGWPGALSSLTALIKVYEYKNAQERLPLYEALNLLLPLVQQIMVNVMQGDQGSQACLNVQHLVLKLFYTLTQHHLPLVLLGPKGEWPVFSQWMEIIRQILDRSNPELEKKPEDPDDAQELAQNEWWKTKKWSMRILFRMFERYGTPGSVMKEYKAFAEFFLKTFSEGAIQIVFKIMESFRRGDFVAEKVMRDALLYLKNAMGHAHAWKFIKPHVMTLLTDVIFPLLCHTKEDEECFNDDPIEYIRQKYGDGIEDESSVFCGEQLLNTMCKKRKGVLPKCVGLVTQVLNNDQSSPQQRDGALHMVGAIADILLKKDEYKDQFDNVIIRFVFPAMDAPYPFIRSRAAWLMSRLSTLKFTREEVMQECLRLLIKSVLTKEEALPVKVEAAFAIEAFIQDQHRSHVYLQPQICALTVELLQILRSTENDDLTNVLQKIVCAFVDDIAPIAYDICVHLANTFSELMESSGDVDSEKTVVAMGLLSTMETVLVVMEEQPEVCLKLEPVLLQVVTLILDKSIMEFYEEAFSLIASLTERQISPAMWQVFEGLYRVVERDGTAEYFVEMMPTLHNYITVDTNAFIGDPNRLLAVCSIIKRVLLDDKEADEDAQSHAAKLIEVLILQYRERIQAVIPNLLQLALERLNKPIKNSELRTMCLQVIVASLYHDINLTASVVPGLNTFVKQWINDTDCFLGLHDRKICVLGFCSLLQSQNMPTALQECSNEVIPSLLMLFDGLKRAYEAKAREMADTDSEEEEEDEDCADKESACVDTLSTDEDEIDDESEQYLEAVQRKIDKAKPKAPFFMNYEIVDEEEDDDDDDDDYSTGEETALECYSTPLDDDDCTVDEYIIFKEVLMNLQQYQPDWYNALTSNLNDQQKKAIQEIFTTADQRKAAAHSKEISKRGGFEFRQQAVPSSFNFGSGNAPPSFS